MSTLPLPSRINFLLSFDYDGTLHDPASAPAIDPNFFLVVEQLRNSYGAVWGINTGRSMKHLMNGLNEGHFPFMPDFSIVCEREIFFPKENGIFTSERSWNDRCAADLHHVFHEAAEVLEKIREHIRDNTGAHWMEEEDGSIGIIAQSCEEMDWIVEEVKKLAIDHPHLGWQRSTIYLRFGHKNYQKGSALGEVARLHGLLPQQVFAIGDSHNDLEMLTSSIAAKLACPANAVTDVCEHVRLQHGYICKHSHSQGVIEALQHFFP